MFILLVLGKNIETTKATKLNTEKLPILPKPPKSFTQPHKKKVRHCNFLSYLYKIKFYLSHLNLI